MFYYMDLITSISVLLFGFFVFSKNRRQIINQLFFLFSCSVFVWLFFYALAFKEGSSDNAYHLFRLGYIGVSFIPTTWVHFTLIFLDQKFKYRTFCIAASYVTSGVFTILSLFTGVFIKDVHVYEWGLYPAVNPVVHVPFLVFFISLFSLTITLLFLSLLLDEQKLNSVKAVKIRYILVATVVGAFAAIDFLANYGISVYPIGSLFMLAFILITTNSIIKYRLLDVKIIFTRTGIFVAVYSLVLGLPFAIAFGMQEYLMQRLGERWWIVPLLTSTLLGTIGPYIYIYVQKKAEDRILQEQRQYQATLRQASLGMGQIKDLKRLLNLIVHVVTRAVKIENCKIFLRHEDSKQYILKAVKGNKHDLEGINKLSFDSPLVHYFNQLKEPLVYEEIKQRRFDIGGEGLKDLEKILEEIDSALVVPSFIEHKLIAIISLGKKRSGKLYTYDDLAVFAILANQSALAIENAQFYEDMKRTHVQLMKAEKMATVGTMADGLSHQINNRLHAMGFIAGDLLDTVRLGLKNGVGQKQKDLLQEIEGGLVRIQENVKHGGEIVGGLLRYTRKGEKGYTAVDLSELLKSAFEMAQFKIKVNMLDVHRHFDKDSIPQIKGNFTQLQEVFFNLIDNSYDAMMQRLEELKEAGYKPRLDIYAREAGPTIEIIMQDNGIGVKDTDMHKLFTPFFTTKATSKKGTGLGLYVIRQIIEDNHGGKVNFSSKYKIGSETQIILPIAVGAKG